MSKIRFVIEREVGEETCRGCQFFSPIALCCLLFRTPSISATEWRNGLPLRCEQCKQAEEKGYDETVR